MSVREDILASVRSVAADQNLELASLTDDLALADAGLDSLGFAILASRLAFIMGRDPFMETCAAQFPRTIGDLIEIYDEAFRREPRPAAAKLRESSRLLSRR